MFKIYQQKKLELVALLLLFQMAVFIFLMALTNGFYFPMLAEVVEETLQLQETTVGH